MLGCVLLFCSLAAAAAGPPVVKSRADIERFKKTLEDSIKDDGLSLEQRMAANPKANAWENSGKFEGDILLDESTIESMVNAYSTNNRVAYIVANTKWPSATAVYEFGSGEFSLSQQRHILSVMDILSANTCVKFRQKNANDRDFIRITGASNGCYAQVGYWQGRGVHTLNLARDTPGRGCLNSIVVAHEWLHAFGFFHMQSAYNRDDYVRIHWENVMSGQGHNFDRYENWYVSMLGLAYEYGSCMHYGTHAFSANGRPTLSTTRHYDGVLGQTSVITGTDFWRLARHYNCPGAWSDAALEKARTTVYAQQEDGTLVEQAAELHSADELELLEESDDAEQ